VQKASAVVSHPDSSRKGVDAQGAQGMASKSTAGVVQGVIPLSSHRRALNWWSFIRAPPEPISSSSWRRRFCACHWELGGLVLLELLVREATRRCLCAT